MVHGVAKSWTQLSDFTHSTPKKISKFQVKINSKRSRPIHTTVKLLNDKNKEKSDSVSLKIDH